MKKSNPQPLVPWNGDVLKREAVARYLTKYLVQRFDTKQDGDKGFVLAINADWGFGKTFLLKNWAEELRSLNHAAVYFDAWQNDFTPEPLVAFISEIDKSLSVAFNEIPVAKRLLKQAVGKAKQLWKPAGKILLEVATKRIAGMSTEQLAEIFAAMSADSEVGDDVIDESSGSENSAAGQEKRQKTKEEFTAALSKSFESSLKDHADKKAAISAFREKLSLLINALDKSSKFQLPVFIFVDELDRCRPDYAIELLEGIKHLFGVPGIYFVVGANLDQLAESTKAIYGAGFDGGRYLKRFFDLEYSLPIPDDAAFAQTLFDTAAISNQKVFLTKLSEKFYGTEHHTSQLFAMYAKSFGLGLRDQQHVMRHVEASVASIETTTVHAHYLFFLSMLYYKTPKIFDQLFDKFIGQEDFRKLLSEQMKIKVMIQCRDSTRQDPKPRDTPLEDIAWLYYQTSKKSLQEIRNEEINAYDFPRNLLIDVGNEMPNSSNPRQIYKPSIADYPNLIRQAGHFA